MVKRFEVYFIDLKSQKSILNHLYSKLFSQIVKAQSTLLLFLRFRRHMENQVSTRN